MFKLNGSILVLIIGLAAWGCGDSAASSFDTESDVDSTNGGDGGAELGSDSSSDSESGAEESFELLWTDEFETIDTSRWQLMTHSWDGNLSQFTGENAAVADGILSLSLTSAEDDTVKPFRGVEMRSVETITYGKFEASVQFAPGSAVVSSLVAIYTPWPPDDWNEIDIEFLGKNDDRIQFNHMVNIPPADPETGHIQFPEMSYLEFDPSADFHTYAVEWVPDAVRFYIDGELLYTATDEIDYLQLPQNILLTIWASDSAGWAGAVDETTAPTAVRYDWFKLYRYTGE